MRPTPLFIATVVATVVACGGAPSASRPPPPPGPLTTAVPAVTVAPPPPAPPVRGEACLADAPCAAGLLCLPGGGGTCTSMCGPLGDPCDDGVCVATPRDGALCLPRCTRDADCRQAEGFVCEPQWRACVLPNQAAIVPRTTCPPSPGPGLALGAGPGPTRGSGRAASRASGRAASRALGFAPSTQLTGPATVGVHQLAPGAILGERTLVTLYSSRDRGEAVHLEGATVAGATVVPVTLPTDAAVVREHTPRLARDAAGTLYAVSVGEDERAWRRIVVRTSRDDGASWQLRTAIPEATACAGPRRDPACFDRPLIAIGRDPAAPGRELVHLVLASPEGTRVLTSRDHGAHFEGGTLALLGTAAAAVVDDRGRLHVIALDGSVRTGPYGNAAHTVHHAVSTDGGRSFSAPRRLSPVDERLPFALATPALAVDVRRRWLYAAYVRGGRDGAWDIVLLASKDGGASWRRSRLGDTPACAWHAEPTLAVDPTTGTLHLAWYDSSGGGRFAHATCAPGLARCTPARAVSDVPFAALSTGRHDATWLGETQALVVDDRGRTLHAVWTQPVAEAGRIVGRIFHATAALPRR